MKYLKILIPAGALLFIVAAKVTEAPVFQRQHLLQGFVTEGAALGDINGDGKADFVAGPLWYEGPTFEKMNRYRPGEPVAIMGYAHDSFLSFVEDVTGDGKNDILQVSHQPGFHLDLFVQPAEPSDNWPSHRLAASFGGESPQMVDLTGDKKPELIAIREGRWGFFTANWDKPTEPWTFHPISKDRQMQWYIHGLGVGDLNGDKRPDIVEKDGWFEGPADPLSGDWTWHEFKFSEPGGAQMLIYDIDGDGDNDIVTSLAAHAYGVAWFENQGGGGTVKLVKHIIMPTEPQPSDPTIYSQTHGLASGDLNGDGLTDFVTGKRYYAHNGKDPGANDPAVLYWYELKRGEKGAEFIPHLVDSDSGVGCQVAVGDVNGDGRDDIAIGNKKGVFVFRSR